MFYGKYEELSKCLECGMLDADWKSEFDNAYGSYAGDDRYDLGISLLLSMGERYRSKSPVYILRRGDLHNKHPEMLEVIEKYVKAGRLRFSDDSLVLAEILAMSEALASKGIKSDTAIRIISDFIFDIVEDDDYGVKLHAFLKLVYDSELVTDMYFSMGLTSEELIDVLDTLSEASKEEIDFSNKPYLTIHRHLFGW